MLERLERVLRALDTKQPLDTDSSNWLRQAIIRHILEGVSLDRALNLSGSRSKFSMDRRNYCIVKAAQVLEQNYPDQSIWQLAERLAELLARFSAVRWGRLEFKPEPDDLSALDRWLFRALKTGQKPVGHNQVYNILLKNVGGSNFSQLVINFYHRNKLDTQIMTKQQRPIGRRITDAEALAFWEKRHKAQAERRQREHEAAAEEMRRRLAL